VHKFLSEFIIKILISVEVYYKQDRNFKI